MALGSPWPWDRVGSPRYSRPPAYPDFMKRSGRLRSGVVAAIVFLACAAPARAQKAVFLVRHAEKVDESDDPLLSAAGKARARALARSLRTAGVKAIYVTQYKRTGLTAGPLATAAGLKPIVVHSDARQEVVDRIRKDNPNDVVLVVGHSNTVPDVLRLLGHPEPVTIAPAEYDNLFVAIPSKAAAPMVLRLRY
jgi:broad specificity phosphatase PhoE